MASQLSKAGGSTEIVPRHKAGLHGGRESDIYDLFMEKQKDESGPDLLVRLEKSRNRKTEQGNLWRAMKDKPEAGALKIHIPRRDKKPARDAAIERALLGGGYLQAS